MTVTELKKILSEEFKINVKSVYLDTNVSPKSTKDFLVLDPLPGYKGLLKTMQNQVMAWSLYKDADDWFPTISAVKK